MELVNCRPPALSWRWQLALLHRIIVQSSLLYSLSAGTALFLWVCICVRYCAESGESKYVTLVHLIAIWGKLYYFL